MRTYGWGDEEALNDPIGAVHCEEGRVVAFPNVLQHCVQVSSDYVMHPSFAASTPPHKQNVVAFHNSKIQNGHLPPRYPEVLCCKLRFCIPCTFSFGAEPRG